MKKALVVLLALVLAGSLVFALEEAAIPFGSWGRALWNVAGGTNDEPVTDVHQSWGGAAPRTSLNVRGDSDNVSYALDIFGNGNGLGLGDNAYIEVRPGDWAALTLGKMDKNETRGDALVAPRQYALSQAHKHLPEMTAVSGLSHAPVFCPVVGAFYSGMEVTVPLFASALKGGASAEDIKRVYADLYVGRTVFYRESAGEDGFLSAGAYTGKDSMEISVHGNGDRILLVARYDNLGKGASGAAVECMNLVLGEAAEKGLQLD